MLGLPRHFSSPTPSFSSVSISTSFFSHWFTFCHQEIMRKCVSQASCGSKNVLAYLTPPRINFLADRFRNCFYHFDKKYCPLPASLKRGRSWQGFHIAPYPLPTWWWGWWGCWATLCWMYLTISRRGNFCLDWEKSYRLSFYNFLKIIKFISNK